MAQVKSKTVICEGISEIVGKTPLVRLKRIVGNLNCRILAKLESRNPTGSIKDRVAHAMIEDAKKRGLLGPGRTVIEPSSGNLAISLACICAQHGYALALIMPESTPAERIKLLKAFGAQITLTPKREGMIGSLKKATELVSTEPGTFFMPQQFKNPVNPLVHEKTTAREIWTDTKGAVDILVCGIGTGGTISGCARFLKKKKPAIKVVGVEPSASAVLSGGKPGPHSIAGIGAGLVPSLLARDLIDEVVAVPDEAAFDMTRRLVAKEGLMVGISSGAVCWAAMQLAQRPEHEGKTIVFVSPDSVDRYVNTFGLFPI